MNNECMNECEHFDNGHCDKFYDVMCCEHPECKYKQIKKYKQCLDEIEELQKELCRRCDLTFCGNTVCYKILQKIKEVK